MGLINGSFRKLFLFLISVGLFSIPCHAEWQGPTVIVEGEWGVSPGQFKLVSGDTIAYDLFPKVLTIGPNGKIYVGDNENTRVQIFKTDGTLDAIMTPKELPGDHIVGWPAMLMVCNDNWIASEVGVYTQIYRANGDLAISLTTIDGGMVTVDEGCNFYTHNPQNKMYKKYSPAGDLLATYTERPLELGRVTEKPLGGGKYQVKVEYPDKTYTVETEAPSYSAVSCDASGDLYVYTGGEMVRFNDQGVIEGKFQVPEDEFIVTPNPKDLTTGVDATVVIQYVGDPVVASDGSIYMTARTPTHYKILKWTWSEPQGASAARVNPVGKTIGTLDKAAASTSKTETKPKKNGDKGKGEEKSEENKPETPPEKKP